MTFPSTTFKSGEQRGCAVALVIMGDVWRARIVLLTADGVGTNEIMRQAGTSKVTVWRWQEGNHSNALMPADPRSRCEALE